MKAEENLNGIFAQSPRRRYRRPEAGGSAGVRDWGRVQTIVLKALDAFPEALEAVVGALRAEVERSGG